MHVSYSSKSKQHVMVATAKYSSAYARFIAMHWREPLPNVTGCLCSLVPCEPSQRSGFKSRDLGKASYLYVQR